MDGAKNLCAVIDLYANFRMQKFGTLHSRSSKGMHFLHTQLSDDDENVRRLAANKILSVRGKLSGFEVHIETCKDFSGGYIVQSDDEEEAKKDDTVDAEIRWFYVPQINLKAKAYYQLIHLNEVNNKKLYVFYRL